MKKLWVAFLFYFFLFNPICAQTQETDQESTIRNIQRNSFYAELGGLGGIVTINYERLVLLGNKTGLGFRIGAGTAGSTDTASSDLAYTALVEVNFIYGKSKHFLETGIGFTNAFIGADTEQWPPKA